jgi:hypothetical protein
VEGEVIDRRACRACGQPIFFAITVKGRRMPMNPDPVETGLFSIIVNAEGTAYLTEPMIDQERYDSHFASCPAPEEFRRRKRKESKRA